MKFPGVDREHYRGDGNEYDYRRREGRSEYRRDERHRDRRYEGDDAYRHRDEGRRDEDRRPREVVKHHRHHEKPRPVVVTPPRSPKDSVKISPYRGATRPVSPMEPIPYVAPPPQGPTPVRHLEPKVSPPQVHGGGEGVPSGARGHSTRSTVTAPPPRELPSP